MPEAQVIKNMSDVNLRKYAALIIDKAKNNANTAIASYVTAQNFSKMAIIIGERNGIVNPDTRTFYIQKDKVTDTSWNLYIYMKTNSEPETFEWVKLNSDEVDLSNYVQTSAISSSNDATEASDETIPTTLKMANDIQNAVNGLVDSDSIIASDDSSTESADTNIYSALKVDGLLENKEDTKETFTEAELIQIVNAADDDVNNVTP